MFKVFKRVISMFDKLPLLFLSSKRVPSLLFPLHRSFSSLPVNAFSLRTHNCGELRLQNVGERVKLYGWVASIRMDRFVLLRDAYGSVQTIFPRESGAIVGQINPESALCIEGIVADRGKDRTDKMATGDIEVKVDTFEVLNTANTPLPVREDMSIEQTRLTHRYLDLRSKRMQHVLRLRAAVISKMRRYLEDQCGFIDVQTPTLAHPTPGGAAEFPVPATSSGECYSLPQSPQIYKQLLMCGSIDRYYQIAICYRDEAAKWDRQPEFTQLDLELSFTNQDLLLSLIEQIVVHSWPDEMGPKPSVPFPRLSFRDAMDRFGTDKPDMRVPWEIMDCPRPVADNSKAKLFIARGAVGCMTRENYAKWIERTDSLPYLHECGIFTKSSLKMTQKFPKLSEDKFAEDHDISDEDAIVICWGDYEDGISQVLGIMRNFLADAVGLRSAHRFEFVWVLNFPLFTPDPFTGHLESSHHPFTAPIPEHEEQLRKGDNLDQIEAQHYDLVLNGVEIGGGSVRIHNAELQRHVLERILDLPTDELTHFLDALSYGAPPHGGFALGLDRFIALLNSEGDTNCTIRDVIAFPKASSGRCLMTNSPTPPSKKLLDRYGLRKIKKPSKELLGRNELTEIK